MESLADLEKELNCLSGSLLLIGELDDKNFPITNNKKIKSVFYLDSNTDCFKEDDVETSDIALNMHLRDLHKYFKDGVDNIYCNFDEIENHIPAFVRESLRITKKNIYLVFNNKKDYKKIEKKYKRYNLNCNLYSFDKCNIAIVEANDIIIHSFKELRYYIVDNIERIYDYISDNI